MSNAINNNGSNDNSGNLAELSSDEQEMMLAKTYIKGKFQDNNAIIDLLSKKNKHGKHDKKIRALSRDNGTLKDFFKSHKKAYRLQKEYKGQSKSNTNIICNCLWKCLCLFSCCSKTKNPSKQV